MKVTMQVPSSQKLQEIIACIKVPEEKMIGKLEIQSFFHNNFFLDRQG